MADDDFLGFHYPGPMVGPLTTNNNNEDIAIMDHPPLLSPPIGPLPGLDLGPMGGPPMPFDPLFPPHFMGPGGFMPPPPPPDGSMMPPMFGMPPPLPPSGLMADLRPPPLGMIATGSFDVDYRRDLTDAPMSMPGRYPSPPRRYTASPLGSERSGCSDRSDYDYDDRYRYIDVLFGFGQSVLRLSVVDLM